MKLFIEWFLTQLPSFLMSEPLCYFVGFAFLFVTAKVVFNIMSIGRQLYFFYFCVKGVIITGEAASYTIATMLTDIGSMVTSAVQWIGSFVGAITDNKLLLGFVLVALIGTGVGLINRLIRV